MCRDTHTLSHTCRRDEHEASQRASDGEKFLKIIEGAGTMQIATNSNLLQE